MSTPPTEREAGGPPAAPSPLEVVGQVMLEFDRGEARVDFRHDTIDVELPDLRAGLALFKQFPAPMRRDRLRRLQAELARAGLALQIWVGRDPVGRLGANARPGFASRLLRVDPVEVRASALVRLFLAKRTPAGPDANPS